MPLGSELVIWCAICLVAYFIIEIIEDTMHKVSHKKSAANNTCWKNFSRYIRLRDAIATTGTMTHARCITCGAVLPVDDLQAGHMIPGRTNGILFDESMVFAQCYACNVDGGGEKQMFRHVMVERNGEAWYDIKVRSRSTPTKLTDFDLRAMNAEYLEKIRKLKEQFVENEG